MRSKRSTKYLPGGDGCRFNEETGSWRGAPVVGLREVDDGKEADIAMFHEMV